MGSSYLPLAFRNSNLINIKNYNDKCFKYCIIAYILSEFNLIKDHLDKVIITKKDIIIISI